MNFSELFRSVIGFPRRENVPRVGKHKVPPDDDGDGDKSKPKGFDHDIFYFGGDVPDWFDTADPSRRGPRYHGNQGLHDDDHTADPESPHGHGPAMFGRHMMDMFKHFDDVFKEFEKMTIGEALEGGGFAWTQPHLPDSSQPSDSLRDSMLKEPDSGIPPPRPPPPGYDNMAPPRPPPPNYGDTAPPRPPPPHAYADTYSHDHQDTDLDEEIRKGNLEIVFGNRADMSTSDLLRPYSHSERQRQTPTQEGKSFKSVAVRTFRSADGRVEERRSIQDARGNEQTTITRTMGDQGYSETTTRDYTGAQNIHEEYKNMSEADKAEFNRQWREFRYAGRGGGVANGDIMRRDPGVIDAETRSIFRNLFGQSFPGFPSDLS